MRRRDPRRLLSLRRTRRTPPAPTLPAPTPMALAFAILTVEVDLETQEADWNASILGRTGHRPTSDRDLTAYLRPAIEFQYARGGGAAVVVLDT